MESIAYLNAVNVLQGDVPELADVFRREQLKWGAEPIPAHIAYGSLFSDFLRRIVTDGTLKPGQPRSEIIRRSFRLIEKLAQSTDFETRCIVEASVLESLLGHDEGDWQRFSPFFGKCTLELAYNVAASMGIPINRRKR